VRFRNLWNLGRRSPRANLADPDPARFRVDFRSDFGIDLVRNCLKIAPEPIQDRPQDRSRPPQERSKIAKDRPKNAQDRLQRPPKRPKTANKGPKSGPRLPTLAPEAAQDRQYYISSTAETTHRGPENRSRPHTDASQFHNRPLIENAEENIEEKACRLSTSRITIHRTYRRTTM